MFSEKSKKNKNASGEKSIRISFLLTSRSSELEEAVKKKTEAQKIDKN